MSAGDSTSASSSKQPMGWVEWFGSFLPGSSTSLIDSKQKRAQNTAYAVFSPINKEVEALSTRDMITAKHLKQSRKNAMNRVCPLPEFAVHSVYTSSDRQSNFTTLDLSTNKKISPEEFIAIIQANPNITSLNINGCYRLDDKCFAALHSLKLIHLKANLVCNITQEGFALIPLDNLERLELQGCNVDDNFCEVISKAKRLICLDLSQTATYGFYYHYVRTPDLGIIGDNGLRFLSEISSLQYLNIGGYRVRNVGEGLLSLKNLSNLQNLDISSAEINLQDVAEPELLGFLSNLTKLKNLNLNWVVNDPRSLKALTNLELETLGIQSNKSLVSGLKFLPDTLTTLSLWTINGDDLGVGDEGNFTEIAYQEIGRLTRLTTLESPRCNLNSWFISQYWDGITQLQKVSFKSSGDGIKELCENNPGIVDISIESVIPIEDQFATPISRLRSLKFFNIKTVTPDYLVLEMAKQTPKPPLTAYSSQTTYNRSSSLEPEKLLESLESFSDTLSILSLTLPPEYQGNADMQNNLSRLNKLTRFSLNSNLPPDQLSFLSYFQLKYLALGGNGTELQQINHEVFQQIGRMTECQNLSLVNITGIQNSDLGLLQTTRMDSIYITGSGQWINNEISSYVENVSTLTFLILEYGGAVGGSTMKTIADEMNLLIFYPKS